MTLVSVARSADTAEGRKPALSAVEGAVRLYRPIEGWTGPVPRNGEVSKV